MKRHAFKMKLTPGQVNEYQRRHDKIWPELVEELRRAGISDYSIFYDEETSSLFAVQKLTDENQADDLPNQAVVRKWWDYMNDGIMAYNPDGTPMATPLREVFHMD